MEERINNYHLSVVYKNLKCSLINHIWLFILVTVLNIFYFQNNLFI